MKTIEIFNRCKDKQAVLTHSVGCNPHICIYGFLRPSFEDVAIQSTLLYPRIGLKDC